jgi:hypothetical protein
MRRRIPLWAAAVAVTLALLAAIGTAGLVDHTLKGRRMDRAEVSEWYCGHEQRRCGGPSSKGIEDAWNQRERGYQIALGFVAAVGAAVTIAARARLSSRRLRG